MEFKFFDDYHGDYWFLNTCPRKKCPVNGFGKKHYQVKNWNNKDGKKPYITHLLKTFCCELKDDIGYSVKCGRQPNNDFLIGLDFDIIGKDGKSWKKYDNAQALFDEFRDMGENGIWKSGTDGNYGCLVKLMDKDLIQRIEESNMEPHVIAVFAIKNAIEPTCITFVRKPVVFVGHGKLGQQPNHILPKLGFEFGAIHPCNLAERVKRRPFDVVGIRWGAIDTVPLPPYGSRVIAVPLGPFNYFLAFFDCQYRGGFFKIFHCGMIGAESNKIRLGENVAVRHVRVQA